LSVGADSTIAPIVAAGLAAAAASSQLPPHMLAPALALMVGAMLLAVTLLRLHWLADLLSAPVGAGMMTGIATHIAIGRLPDLLGLDPRSGSLVEVLTHAAAGLGRAQWPPLAVGLGAATVCVVLARIDRRAPGPLLALVLGAVAAEILSAHGRPLARLDPGAGLAGLGPPVSPGLDDLLALAPVALIIAFLCVAQTAVVTRDPEGDDGGDGRGTEKAILSVGVGNLVAGAVGAFAVNASPPRSRIAAEAGARSQLAGLLAAVLAVAAVGFGADLLRRVPEAALAGVLLFIAVRLPPVRLISRIARHAPGELALFAVGASLVELLPMQIGLAFAVVLALLNAVSAMLRPRAGEFLRVPGTTVWWRAGAAAGGARAEGVLVFGFGAPVNFVTVRPMLAALRAAVHGRPTPPRLVVIEATGVIDMDFTGATLLRAEIARLRAAGVDVAMARLESDGAQQAADRLGLLDALGPNRVRLSVEDAITAFAASQADRPSETIGRVAQDAARGHPAAWEGPDERSRET
jgi:MFS superfamily sulfate permease-like transporter